MNLEAFNDSLPEAIKMRRSLWDKVPYDALGANEVANSILSHLIDQEVMEFFENIIGSNEV